MSRLSIAIFVVVVGILTAAVFVECRWYQNGLVFYDIATKKMILPPTVSVQRGRSIRFTNVPIFSKLGQPCTCKGLLCGCCAGLEVREYNFNQKMCANVTFVPEKEEALLDVFLNEQNRARYGISARNPSPLCVPIMMPLPMAACIQMTDVGLKGNNLHMCMDFVMRLHTTDAMELHFNCLSMGQDGVQYLDKNGKPVLPRTASSELDDNDGNNDEEYDDDDEEDDSADDEESPEAGQGKGSSELQEDEENFDDEEESGDGPSYESDPGAGEIGEYEDADDTDDAEDSDDVDEVTQQAVERLNKTELLREENYITDNIIKLYETE